VPRNVGNWREWFVPPDGSTSTEAEQMDQVRVDSGAGHRDEDNFRKRAIFNDPPKPKCVSCQATMSYDDGMYIMISGDWRLHITCFEEVIERHFEDGEVIDLTTGQVIKVDPDVQK
jgi:hypothetical protein